MHCTLVHYIPMYRIPVCMRVFTWGLVEAAVVIVVHDQWINVAIFRWKHPFPPLHHPHLSSTFHSTYINISHSPAHSLSPSLSLTIPISPPSLSSRPSGCPMGPGCCTWLFRRAWRAVYHIPEEAKMKKKNILSLSLSHSHSLSLLCFFTPRNNKYQ